MNMTYNPDTNEFTFSTKAQSEHLKNFYTQLNYWMQGNQSFIAFKPEFGICDNLAQWLNTCDINNKNRIKIVTELENQFISNGLNSTYPFNNSGARGIPNTSFTKESNHGNMYFNPMRRAWIKFHAFFVPTPLEYKLPSYMGPYHIFHEPSFDEGYSMNVMDDFGNSISING